MHKKIVKIGLVFLWISLVGLFLFLVSFAHVEQHKMLLKEIDIHVNEEHAFITSDNIQKILRDKKIVPGKPMQDIDIYDIEHKLEANPFAKNVDVYKTMDGVLRVNIRQRNPILRVYNMRKESFYIDNEGYLMPASHQYAPRVLVASGYIFDKVNDNASLIKKLNLPEDSLPNDIILELFKMASYIQEDPFWSKQMAMMYINEHSEIECTTLLGSQRILFGKSKDKEEKFKKLFTLYQEGFSRTGWNIYDKIDIRYKDQIVCKKKNYE